MSISTSICDNGTHITIKINGKFDYNLQQEFKKSYESNHSQSDCQNIVSRYTIDLNAVNYLDSSALGMLLSLRTYSNHQDCINIIGAKPAIKELLELSGFDRLFTLTPIQTAKL